MDTTELYRAYLGYLAVACHALNRAIALAAQAGDDYGHSMLTVSSVSIDFLRDQIAGSLAAPRPAAPPNPLDIFGE